jgi:hypothetical protein
MRRCFITTILVVFAPVLILSGGSFALSTSNPNTGTDVSWPNCDVSPPNSSWGIVGVTGGLDFTKNQCVYKESTWFGHYGLYMNTGYPGVNYALKYASNPITCKISNNLCLAYNFGYNSAKYALDYASLQDVHSNQWWLDVETVNSWSSNLAENRADLEGAEAYINHNTLLTTVGFYSDSLQWTTITGNWKNQAPGWVATGSTSLAVAQQGCLGDSFTRGTLELSQYTLALDRDYSCSPYFASTIR